MRSGTPLLTVALTVIALVFGRSAPAAPALSFDSVTVTADGTNPTPVQILVNVTNPNANINVSTLVSALTWTATGGATLTDLSSTGVISANQAGYLFQPVFDSANLQTGSTLPLQWGISTTGSSVTMTGSGATTPVATLNFQIPAGVRFGDFSLSFATNGENSFYASDLVTPIPYTNGNNGSTRGVISVVPEPVSTSVLAVCAVLVTGAGLAQRSARRRSRRVEIDG